MKTEEITKRESIAKDIMVSLIQGLPKENVGEEAMESWAKIAIQGADILLKNLNLEQKSIDTFKSSNQENKLIVFATFQGKNNSRGYIRGKNYYLTLTIKDNKLIIDEKNNPITGIVIYNSLKLFLDNWEVIK